jgi:hypothetical protein
VTLVKAVALILVLLAASPFAHGACAEKYSRQPTFMALAVPEGAPRPADANAFSIVNDDLTIQKLFAAVGPPDASDGTSTTIYVYCLPDGSEVRVGTLDGTTILYVRHDRKEMYQRKKKKK